MITAKEILPLYKQAIDYQPVLLLKAKLAQLRRARQPFYLTSAELEQILEWKLGRLFARQRPLRLANTDEVVRAVTGLALTITHDDKEYELELRTDLLCALRGVGVPVASAVLGLAFPKDYAVLDTRCWRQLFDENKTVFLTRDYKRYMAKIRPLGYELGWPVQEVDHAIWEYDRRARVGGGRPNPLPR